MALRIHHQHALTVVLLVLQIALLNVLRVVQADVAHHVLVDATLHVQVRAVMDAVPHVLVDATPHALADVKLHVLADVMERQKDNVIRALRVVCNTAVLDVKIPVLENAILLVMKVAEECVKQTVHM